ncbi:hypothetical protein AB1Y20_003032 [Prymnesium parvum]|uniref:Inositol-phosphate phosphatase n=1 Tax=Prymnesium parvum TaxID=97485 RepID=A0AB34JC34_PRYPA
MAPLLPPPAFLKLSAASLSLLAAGALLWWRRRGSPRRPSHRWVASTDFGALSREACVAAAVALRCGEAMRATAGAHATLKDGEGERAGIDPVTATDEANEALVYRTLRRAFPSHEVIGEEASAKLGAVPAVPRAVPTWVVDPIDGTQNFVHALPLSVVSIGLCIGGEPTLGVVYDPYLEELFVGVVGKGAYLNGRKICPDRCTTLEKAMVLTDVGYERSAQGVARISAALAALLNANTFALRMVGSSVQALTWVAAGRASAFYIGFGKKDCPKPWDWCAACAIGKACGVTFQRLDSDAPFDLTSSSCIVASTPQLAATLSELLRLIVRA